MAQRARTKPYTCRTCATYLLPQANPTLVRHLSGRAGPYSTNTFAPLAVLNSELRPLPPAGAPPPMMAPPDLGVRPVVMPMSRF